MYRKNWIKFTADFTCQLNQCIFQKPTLNIRRAEQGFSLRTIENGKSTPQGIIMFLMRFSAVRSFPSLLFCKKKFLLIFANDKSVVFFNYQD